MADCVCLENRSPFAGTVGSNPTSSVVLFPEFDLMSMTVLRSSTHSFDEILFRQECEKLASQTKYRFFSKSEEAPEKTNCVTSIRYLFKKCIGYTIPCVWIGDMPRSLVSDGWVFEQKEICELKAGDLIFMASGAKEATPEGECWIVHVLVVMDRCGSVFHSSQTRGGGAIENLTNREDPYVSKILNRAVDHTSLYYIDPRNLEMRTEFGQAFIPDPLNPSSCLAS